MPDPLTPGSLKAIAIRQKRPREAGNTPPSASGSLHFHWVGLSITKAGLHAFRRESQNAAQEWDMKSRTIRV